MSNQLAHALDKFFSLPNWENRIGYWKDINAGLNEVYHEHCRQHNKPTSVGLKKFTPHGFYDGEACTCAETCADCKGQCGCHACECFELDARSARSD